jgi:glycosyltransferase involved in cell wall biosynthesis
MLGGASGDRRRRALVLCPEAPYPVVGGGPIRTASLLEYLAQRYSIDVVVFREPGAPSPEFPAGIANEVRTIDLPFHSRCAPARAMRNLVRYATARPPLNDRFAGFAGPLADFLQGRRYDLALVEHFWCAPYAAQLAPHAARLVLDLHNIESALYGCYAASEPWPVSWIFRRFERSCSRLESEWLPRYSLTLVTSEEDAARARRIARGAKVQVYPNALPDVPQPQVPEENVVVFSGNLEYRPNIAAVRFFAREVWPRLRESRPGLVWRIVGKNPGGVAAYVRGDPRIELRGPVEDAVAELAAARVVVAPLDSGSGTRIKILEAWAAGRAVVSTTVGAEGLEAMPGEHLLIADSADVFAAAVLRLLDSPAEREKLGRAGRRLFECRFTWPRAWEALAGIGL